MLAPIKAYINDGHFRMDKNQYIENSINESLIKFTPIICLGGAVIFICLSALDYVSKPEYFLTFLGYRVIISSVLLFIFLILRKYTFRSILIYKFLLFMGAVGSAFTVELMILKTGGDISSYYVGIGLVGVWVISFTPVRFTLSSILMLAVYGTYVLPIIATEKIADFRIFFTSNIFLLSLLSSALVLRYIYFSSLVNELGLKYDLEQHKINLENQVNDRTARLSDSIARLQKEIGARERIELALNKASSEWRATFDSTTDVIMTLNTDYIVRRLNKAGTLFYNRPFKDLIGTPLSQLFPLDIFQKRCKKSVHIETFFRTSERGMSICPKERYGCLILLTRYWMMTGSLSAGYL